MSKETERMWQLAGRYSAVGIEMAAAVGFGTLGGAWLDNRFGTTPWLFWIGFIVGVGAAVRTIQRVIRSFRKSDN